MKNGIAQRRRHKPSAVTFRRPETANAAHPHGYWYRRCSGCGEVKRLHDNFQRRGGRRDAFGLVPRMYYCKSCMRARSKAAYEHTKQTNTYAYLKMRERVARNQKAWREANPEKYRAQIQRGLAKRTRRYWDDPEYRRALLDASTERKRLRRLQAGLPIRARRRGRDRPIVPLEPFARWLDEVLPMMQREDGAVGSLAKLLGVPERTLFRWRAREHKFVAVDHVDRALLAWGEPMLVVLNGTGKRTYVVGIDDLYPPREGINVLEVSPFEAPKVFAKDVAHA